METIKHQQVNLLRVLIEREIIPPLTQETFNLLYAISRANNKELNDAVYNILRSDAMQGLKDSTLLTLSSQFTRSVIFTEINNALASAISLLLKNGANPNTADEQGKTALMHVSGAKGCGWIMRDFFHANVDLDVRDQKNNTALHYAAMRVSEAILPLVSQGASVSLLGEDNKSPLEMLSAKSRYDFSGNRLGDIAKVFLENGATLPDDAERRLQVEAFLDLNDVPYQKDQRPKLS